jgi:hypothetical protein
LLTSLFHARVRRAAGAAGERCFFPGLAATTIKNAGQFGLALSLFSQFEKATVGRDCSAMSRARAHACGATLHESCTGARE